MQTSSGTSRTTTKIITSCIRIPLAILNHVSRCCLLKLHLSQITEAPSKSKPSKSLSQVCRFPSTSWFTILKLADLSTSIFDTVDFPLPGKPHKIITHCFRGSTVKRVADALSKDSSDSILSAKALQKLGFKWPHQCCSTYVSWMQLDSGHIEKTRILKLNGIRQKKYTCNVLLKERAFHYITCIHLVG